MKVRVSGTITKLVQDKGFGFIRDDVSGQEYFFHKSGVRDAIFEDLQPHHKVTFITTQGPKGPRAEEVTLD